MENFVLEAVVNWASDLPPQGNVEDVSKQYTLFREGLIKLSMFALEYEHDNQFEIYWIIPCRDMSDRTDLSVSYFVADEDDSNSPCLYSSTAFKLFLIDLMNSHKCYLSYNEDKHSYFESVFA